MLGAYVYDKQLQMVESLIANRRTAVVGANGSGKDFTAGRAALFWLKYWEPEPAKVVITGPTFRQVQEIVWREARQAYHDALVPLGGDMLPRQAMWNLSDDTFAIGFSTDQPYNLQGFHSPHLLVIVTEAHAMPQSDMDAIKRLNPQSMLLTGNALNLTGEFWDAFEGENRGHYNTIRISAFDTPNVIERKVIIPGAMTWEDVEERREEWGETDPRYLATVLARFPSSWPNAIYPDFDRQTHLVPMPDGLSWADGAIGVDIGDVHPSAVVAITRDTFGRYWVRECEAKVGDYDWIWQSIERMLKDYDISRSKVYVDPMLKGWEKLTFVHRVDGSPGSRNERIKLVERLLGGIKPKARQAIRGESSEYWVPPALAAGLLLDANGKGNRELAEEMLQYHYEIRETDYVMERVPVRKGEDRVAALEDAIYALEGTRNIFDTATTMGSIGVSYR